MARSNNIGLAGEFYAMHKLFLEGYEATLTLGNTKGIDILVYNPKNEKQFKVEVKTSTTIANERLFGRNMKWIMNKKHENVSDENLIYCFVFIAKTGKEKTRIFFYRPEDINLYLYTQHKKWLHAEHKKKVKDTDMRIFRIGLEHVDKNKFQNNFKIFD